jgi:hypothetical protein
MKAIVRGVGAIYLLTAMAACEGPYLTEIMKAQMPRAVPNVRATTPAKGKIDDFRFYTDALTDTEIGALYHENDFTGN